MTPPIKKLLPAAALTLACSLTTFGLGVATGQQVPAPSDDSTHGAAIEALTTGGGIVELTSSQRAVFDDNSEPLNPEDATFPANVDLTAEEVAERSVEVGESYEIGESVTLEDLEFLRIYAFSADNPEGDPVVASARVSAEERSVAPAVASDALSVELASTSNTDRFNVTKTQYGTTANVQGSMTRTIGDTVTNSWSVNWIAKRVSGTSTTKIVAKANIYGYGATAAWPYVGLIYEAHPSASTTAQSLGFSRTGTFTAYAVYMTSEATSTFYNTKGSFLI